MNITSRPCGIIITHGKGAAIVITPANNAVAPTVPSASYICPAKSGNAEANAPRVNAFAAIADAAMGRYAETRYVNVEEKQSVKPIPKNVVAMMGAIQCTWGYVVNASQKRLTGTMIAPTWPVKRRASGGGSTPGCFV